MAVTEEFPTIPQTPAPRRGRGWSRLQKTVLGLLVLAVVAVFAGVAYLRYAEGKIDRIPAAELASLAAPPGAAAGPVNFLVVGTDDRSQVPEDWTVGRYGNLRGRRTDVIMLAHVVPGKRIQLLSIPRDLEVTIPGHGVNRINAAYVFGGPDLLVRVVQDVTGIPVHHYVEVGFGGVGRIVDALGGVTLEFSQPGRDPISGFHVEAGRHTLDGEMAVAYARSRHYQVYENGTWRSTPGGDIARTRRQQDVLLALFRQVTSPGSAFDLPGFLPVLADQISADEGLSLGVMADLARAALTLRAADVERTTLPVRGEKGNDGRAYVVPTEDAAPVLAAFAAGDPFPGR